MSVIYTQDSATSGSTDVDEELSRLEDEIQAAPTSAIDLLIALERRVGALPPGPKQLYLQDVFERKIASLIADTIELMGGVGSEVVTEYYRTIVGATIDSGVAYTFEAMANDKLAGPYLRRVAEARKPSGDLGLKERLMREIEAQPSVQEAISQVPSFKEELEKLAASAAASVGTARKM